MSIYSGKCDLADHIFMLKHRTKDGSDKKEDLEKARVFYSDELECFNIFKEQTGGVIYMWRAIEATKYNLDLIASMNPFFKYFKQDTLTEKGNKKTIYTYEYFGTEYKTLAQLNKRGVIVQTPIYFNTLLDIIPYYPYIITSLCSSNGKTKCVISDRSYVETEYEAHLQGGYDSIEMANHYRKELQDHYRDVVLRYFDPADRVITEELTFSSTTPHRAILTHTPDKNFDIEWNCIPSLQPHGLLLPIGLQLYQQIELHCL